MTLGTGIDPRGPRVTAGVTGVVVLIVVALGLLGLTTAATILLSAQAVVFLVAAIVGVATLLAADLPASRRALPA